jgi:hypothetical protein
MPNLVLLSHVRFGPTGVFRFAPIEDILIHISVPLENNPEDEYVLNNEFRRD